MTNFRTIHVVPAMARSYHFPANCFAGQAERSTHSCFPELVLCCISKQGAMLETLGILFCKGFIMLK